jgi:hypothetical protein
LSVVVTANVTFWMRDPSISVGKTPIPYGTVPVSIWGRRRIMTPAHEQVTSSSSMPRALVIGAGPEALLGIEPFLGSNRFRVDFLDKDTTPYVAIRRRRPDLVVLCFAPDDEEACQVMQMLQLDPATRRLPILTYINGEAYAIIPNKWPRTSGIPSASSSLERCTAR